MAAGREELMVIVLYTVNSRPQKIPPRKLRSGITACSELVAGVDVGLSTLSLAPVSHIILIVPPHTFT